MTHSPDLPRFGLELRSLITAAGRLELSLEQVEIGAPGPGEIVVQVEATPINPSDLALLIGPADLAGAIEGGSTGRPTLTVPVPSERLAGVAARLDQSLPVGGEGAGLVIAAGAGAETLLGRRVAAAVGGMYAEYRRLDARACLPLPDDLTSVQGAAAFVNPLTALGMVETMRLEGHTALVHTAAASNLGQMLNRLCLKDGIPLVSIVRSPAQAALLKSQGAVHVCDSTAADFMSNLIDAIHATGATLAFDAIGGGRLAGQILVGMEAAINREGGEYSRYGSARHKQVYIYGGLDMSPTQFERGIGFAWGIGGWLLPPFLARIGPQAAQGLRERAIAELTTTFASRFSDRITLADALRLSNISTYAQRATGRKFLITAAL